MTTLRTFRYAALSVLALAACNTDTDTGASTSTPVPDASAPSADAAPGEPGDSAVAIDDAAAPTDAPAQPPSDAEGATCPATGPGEAVFCHTFDGPATLSGAFVVRGDRKVTDAGTSLEDSREYWSAPFSRRLGWTDDLNVRSTGALPVARVTVAFRARPDYAPFGSVEHLVYAKIGDTTVAIVWGDYGRYDEALRGTKGYALEHHVLGAARDTFAPIARFATAKVWSRIELTLDATGARATVEGGTVATVTVATPPSTSASAGFGPYYTSVPGPSPGAFSANVDDVVIRVAR